MYQRIICGEVRNKKRKDAYDEIKEQYINWLEVLVIKICYLCILRNLLSCSGTLMRRKVLILTLMHVKVVKSI